MFSRYRLPLLSALLLLIATRPAQSQQVIFVDVDAPDEGGGTSWTDAYNSLQDALLAAQSGDQLWIAEGQYHPDDGKTVTTGNREESFTIRSGISLYGGFGGSEFNIQQRDIDAHRTILTGDLAGDDQPSFIYRSDNSYHVVTISTVTATETALLDGLTITAGYINTEEIDWYYGAGILCGFSTATIKNCNIIDNFALGGGGIVVYEATLNVDNCRFTNNWSTGGT